MSDPEPVIVHYPGTLTGEAAAAIRERFEETAARAREHARHPSAACRRTFSTTDHAGTCPDCGHAVIAHIGTGSCVICRMEDTLTSRWRQQQARIRGLDARRVI